tara:strand:- start:209 stop:2104 length:1896 start_codon:yes stop_codon:yes gene_type:complete
VEKVKNLILYLFSLSPYIRRSFLITTDLILIFLSLLITLYNDWQNINLYIWLFIVFKIVGIPIYFVTGQYKGITRFVGSALAYQVIIRVFLISTIAYLFGILFNLKLPTFSIFISNWFILSGLTVGIRIFFRDILKVIKGNNKTSKKNISRVAIYGAGSAGAQLAASLKDSDSFEIKYFVDDAPQLWGRLLFGIPVISKSKLAKTKAKIDKVLLAIPSITRKDRRILVNNLQSNGFDVLQIPSIEEITNGNERIDALRPIAIEDLLGRDKVPPDQKLLSKQIKNSVVCVTGAGGSIGSELCLEIVKNQPKALVIIEISEINLYKIFQKLEKLSLKNIPIKAKLCNCTNSLQIKKIFAEEKVEVVFHAAAYKHVPIVEENPISGIYNNVFSTKVVCEASITNQLRLMILISTDKAVRPTNVMGCSKRLAEIVVQAFAQQKSLIDHREIKSETIFAMVRFGNVLGSSGSVVPLFQRQINEGGPITITHPEIIRYFMTISESAQLVLQASSLSTGGEVFLLDMGEPVKIKNLAEQMIKLNGLTVKDTKNPDGDIEIVYTRLRKGEKLFEELLISAKSEPSQHPLIYKANEKFIMPDDLWPRLKKLKSALKTNNLKKTINLMKEFVPEWSNSFKI